MQPLQKLLAAGQPIILDGAMGTMLMNAGLEAGNAPEKWNVLHPEIIQKIHRDYIHAGAQIILTNSFGGNRYRLALHRLADRADEFNKSAAANARIEADKANRLVIVAGSMGPTGQLLKPLGTITAEEAQKAFADQAAALAEGGVDMFWIETMSDLEEVKAAVRGIRSVSTLPISATMSFDTNGHTMMGVSPGKAMEVLGKLDLFSIGANCGTGPEKLQEALKLMRKVNPNALLVAKANAGIPQLIDDQEIYNGTPQVMAEYAIQAREIGAALIGGCCGNTPEHIKAIAKALSSAATE